MNASLGKWQKCLETGISHLGEGNIIEAEAYLKESLRLAEMLEILVIIAFSQRLLATVQVRNQEWEAAELGFNKALSYCLELNNDKGIAEAKAGLASIAVMKSEFTQAIYLYEEAISIYPTDASTLRLAALHSDLGQVYSRIKKWIKAEEAFLQAEKLCQQCDYKKGQAEVSLCLGEQYYMQGKLIKAKMRFSAAAKIFVVIAEELYLANALHYIALISLEKKNIEEALFFQYRVITLYLKYQQKDEISEGYYLLSNILQYRGLLDEAETSIHISLSYFQGDEFGLAVRYHSLAVIFIMKKEYEKAKGYYYKALKHFQFDGNGSKIGEICEELTYLLHYEEGDIQENLYKWLKKRPWELNLPQEEVMVRLAYVLKKKGNNLAALHCGWRALEIAKGNKYETREIETLIQSLSENIRKKIKNKRIW